jgi:hypothetical protein
MSTIIHYSQQVSEETLKRYNDVYTAFVEFKDDLGNSECIMPQNDILKIH